jgi:hypothetical protein
LTCACMCVQGAAEALEAFPAVNGCIEGDNILYRDYVDISIAVGTPKGLVVPVLRGVDQMVRFWETGRARWADAKSSLGDVKSSLGDAKSSLGVC